MTKKLFIRSINIKGENMNRLLRLILVIVLLITCYGCFIPGHGWIFPGGEIYGDHSHGDSGDRDHGGRGDHDNREDNKHRKKH
jgi:hypothetical protein